MLLTNNELISRLSPTVRTTFDPLVTRTQLPARHVLARSGEKISKVYFIESGLAASSWGESGKGPDVSLIGFDGMVGHGVALGADRAACSTVMRIPGAALAMSIDDFRTMLGLPEFRGAILHYASESANQTAEWACAHATLPVLARVARYLLLVSEMGRSSDLAFTHDMIASSLGCRRAGVTLSIHVLEGNGALKARRNRIMITDRAKLVAQIAEAAPDVDLMWKFAPGMMAPVEAPANRIGHRNGAGHFATA